ncbi:MAG: hypothetical protein PHQ43_13600 [Dehalococcoidales bacterium]|nr:hypothetical protein [Dehalococcoidales bacterium]
MPKTKQKVKRWYFKVELVGEGETMEEAWDHALEGWDQRDSTAEDHFDRTEEEDE